jgi:hypothetical protein
MIQRSKYDEIERVIKEKRELLISDNDIYNELKGSFIKKEELARIIVTNPRLKDIQENKKKNISLIILLILLFISYIIELYFYLDLKLNLETIIPGVIVVILQIFHIPSILRYQRTAYKFTFLIIFLYVVAKLNLIINGRIPPQVLLLSIFNFTFSFGVALFSYIILLYLFPNYPLEKDKNGDYVFKD